MQVQTYGVSRSTTQELRSNSTLDVSCLVEQLSFRGFAVAESVLGRDQIADLNTQLDAVYQMQCAEVGGEANLQAINDADIVRSPLAYDDTFLDLCALPLIRDVAQSFLGENIVLLMQNGIINRPDRLQFQTRWHRDLNYQQWVSSRPLAMGALVALEDFNAETGGTVFLPSSQKFADFPSDDLVIRSEQIATAPAGSIIFFDAMTYHRAGVNTSKIVRRAINHVIGAPLLAPQADYPAMLARPAPNDPWLAAYLGYRWTPMTSVASWRQRRIAALP
jgi:ectoine hydroxylase-related dioxygenase (phytanoyl-CoA dioxygenase family)